MSKVKEPPRLKVGVVELGGEALETGSSMLLALYILSGVVIIQCRLIESK